MAAAATFTYDHIADTIDVAVTGATIGHTYKATSYDDDSGGVSHVAAGASFTMTITSVNSSPARQSGVYAWDDFDQTVIGGTIFDVPVSDDEYFNEATWSFDGADTITCTIFGATGTTYGLFANNGDNSETAGSGPFVGANAPLLLTLTGVSAITVPFFIEAYTFTGLYNDWGVRLFTPGVAGAGSPGNPNEAPAVVTEAPTGVQTTSAVLQGTVNPEGVSSTAFFEYGLTVAYGTTTPAQNLGSGSDPVDVEQFVTGLRPGRTYHCRVVRDP